MRPVPFPCDGLMKQVQGKFLWSGSQRRRCVRIRRNADFPEESVEAVPHVPDIGRAGGSVALSPVADVAGILSGTQECRIHFIELGHGETVHVGTHEQDRCVDVRCEEDGAVAGIDVRILEWRPADPELAAGFGLIADELAAEIIRVQNGIDARRAEIVTGEVTVGVMTITFLL